MVGKGIRGGICHTINQYAKTNKYMRDYNENIESSYFKYWFVNNLYGWAMSQKLLDLYMVLSGLKVKLNLVKVS